ncbi:MAG: SpoIID/LytB domain-containing protein [Elusimicrobiota bacterium]
MTIGYKLFLPALIFFFNVPEAKKLPETILRIEIKKDVAGFNLGCEGEFYIYKLSTGDMDKLSGDDINYVKAEPAGIMFDGVIGDPSSVRLVPVKEKELIRIDGRRYRDTIVIRKTGPRKLSVINELGLENYIAGILPCEVDDGWSLEALKAQAVISRTYAMTNLGRHQDDSCDFCNKVHCQVYGGVEGEKKSTNRAVELTRGEILTYNGKPAQTIYHAACAGHTENPVYVWKWDVSVPSYLLGVKDKYCLKSPHQNWSKEIEVSYIIKKLIKLGYKDIKDITSIKFTDITKSGRAKYVKIKYKTNNGSHSIKIRAAVFRLELSPWLLKSTKVSEIRRISPNVFRVSGHGWGHGVGLCQWGSKVMAEAGFTYKGILYFYYPGTRVEKWED